MSKKYIPQGSFLYCDKGVFPTPFLGLEYTEVYLTDVPIATDYDNKPLFNILPFGPCIAKGGQFCLPAPTSTWNDPSAPFCGLVAKPILDDSTLSCGAPGTIRIAPSFMAALMEMYDDPNELIGKFLEYMGAKVENSGHFLWGIAKGAWGTLKFLGTLAIETSPIIQGYQAATDWEGFKDKWQGRYETAEDMANFGMQLYELQYNPAKQAQLFAYLSDGDNWEAAFNTVYDTVAYADHTEVAEVQGMIAFEILLEVLTGGWGAARHVDKIDDLADGARIISNVMDNLDDPARLAENLDDLAVPRVDDIPDGPAGETIQAPIDEVTESSRPEWLRRLQDGNDFNAERAEFYDYNEVYVRKPDGNGYYRLDSYNPGDEIVSRKHSQLSEVQERTAIGYINEIDNKYPQGAEIADVPSNVDGGNAGIFDTGNTLTGETILEIPIQDNPVPQAVIDAANDADVTIRDTNGTIYNP